MDVETVVFFPSEFRDEACVFVLPVEVAEVFVVVFAESVIAEDGMGW